MEARIIRIHNAKELVILAGDLNSVTDVDRDRSVSVSRASKPFNNELLRKLFEVGGLRDTALTRVARPIHSYKSLQNGSIISSRIDLIGASAEIALGIHNQGAEEVSGKDHKLIWVEIKLGAVPKPPPVGSKSCQTQTSKIQQEPSTSRGLSLGPLSKEMHKIY